MKKVILGIITMIIVTSFATGVHAEMKAGAISVSPFIGGYMFEGNEDLKTAPVYGLRAGYNFTENCSLEYFFNYVPTENERAGNPEVKVYGYGMEGLYHFRPGSRLVPFLAAGVGGTRYSGAAGAEMDTRNKLTLDYGGGLKYFLLNNIALRADVRHIIPFNDRHDNLLYTVGIDFSFGGAKKAKAEPVVQVVREDSDGDGVYDAVDKCPGTPAGVKVDKDGCPLDTDRDGVYDYLDKCPGTPAGVRVDKDGCPLDADRDGVYDHLDKCPGTPAGVKVDKDGCPLDTDRDGVYDYLDKCPGTPAGVKVDRDGCPLDTDGDGVYDYLDKCPGTPAGVKVDKDGCPPPPPPPPAAKKPEAPKPIEKAIMEKGRATLNVEFDTNKAIVKPKYHGEIGNLAEVLKKYPDIKIEIQGHTDNVGAAKYNEKLSQRRADAIKKYLADKFGIEASRLTAKGYGLTKPIASNATKAGRQNNRRVEAVAEYLIKK